MFTLNLAQVFSTENCEISKNTFEDTSNFVENLGTAAPVKCYLQIADFVIISYPSYLRVFVKQVTIFYGSQAQSLLILFSKESVK